MQYHTLCFAHCSFAFDIRESSVTHTLERSFHIVTHMWALISPGYTFIHIWRKKLRTKLIFLSLNTNKWKLIPYKYCKVVNNPKHQLVVI